MTYRFDRRQFLLCGAAATGALALGGCAVVPRSDAGDARALYDRIFQAMLRGSPELATGLGLDTGANADLRGRLGLSGPAGKRAPTGPWSSNCRRCAGWTAAASTGREKAFLDTVLWLGERVEEVSRTPYGTFDGYPVPYVLSQLTGSYQSVPDFLDSQHKIETRADAEAYISRLEAFARNVDLEVEQARADAGRGVVPPDFILDKTITQTRALRGQHGEQAGPGPVAGPPRPREEHRRAIGRGRRRRSSTAAWPTRSTASSRMLTELRRGAGHNPAASRLPGGARFYAQCLRFHTRTGMSPDQVHETGLRQIAELSAEAEPLLRARGPDPGQCRRADHRARPAGAVSLSEYGGRPRPSCSPISPPI